MANQSNKKLRLNPWLIGCVLSALMFAACGGDETIESSSGSGDNTPTSVGDAVQTDADASAESVATQSTITLPADDEVTESDTDDEQAGTDPGADQNDGTQDDGADSTDTDSTDSTDTELDQTGGDDSAGSATTGSAGAADSSDSADDSTTEDAISEIELIATMAALGIDPDSEAGQCMRENKDLITTDSANSGDSIYVAAKCAPGEIGAIVAQTETLGDLTPAETECVMTEALSYMASLPEAEARAAFSQSRIPQEYALEIIPIAEEKCGVGAERFADDFSR